MTYLIFNHLTTYRLSMPHHTHTNTHTHTHSPLFCYLYLWVSLDCLLRFHSCVWLFAVQWITAHKAPLSMGFSRQEYWNELPFPTPSDLPDLGTKPTSLASPALASRLFTDNATWGAHVRSYSIMCLSNLFYLA